VVIVNQALAYKAFGPDRSPVGETLRFFWSNWQSYEVIGVVADTRSYGLASGPSPELFVPHAQIPYTVMNVVVRTTGEEAGLAEAVKGAFLSLDPQQPAQTVVAMKDLISNSTARERFAFIWLGALAFLALSLATIGTYSVVSYLTVQRSREIALRVTLGATPRQIIALSMGRGAALASVGVGLGLVGSWALGHLVASLLFQVPATDLGTFTAVSALLLAATLCAAWVPARRATRVDPIAVLHQC
jgi:ABC-type antimicrobial peptide transport system permease subunit